MAMTTRKKVPYGFLSLLKQDDKGFHVSLFNEQLQAICTCCKAVCCDAVQLGCDHQQQDIRPYCKKCLSQLIADNDNKCPINSHNDPIVKLWLFPRLQILRAEVVCPCSWTFKSRTQEVSGSDVSATKEQGDQNAYCEWKGSFKQLLYVHSRECKWIKNKLANSKAANTSSKLQTMYTDIDYQQQILQDEAKREASMNIFTSENNGILKFIPKIVNSSILEKLFNKMNPANPGYLQMASFPDLVAFMAILYLVKVHQQKTGTRTKPKLDNKQIRSECEHISMWIARKYLYGLHGPHSGISTVPSDPAVSELIVYGYSRELQDLSMVLPEPVIDIVGMFYHEDHEFELTKEAFVAKFSEWCHDYVDMKGAVTDF